MSDSFCLTPQFVNELIHLLYSIDIFLVHPLIYICSITLGSKGTKLLFTKILVPSGKSTAEGSIKTF